MTKLKRNRKHLKRKNINKQADSYIAYSDIFVTQILHREYSMLQQEALYESSSLNPPNSKISCWEIFIWKT